MKEKTIKSLAQRYKALSDPTRLKIISELARQSDMCVSDLVKEFTLSQPTISTHLKFLKEEGFLKERRNGKNTFYSLNIFANDPEIRMLIGIVTAQLMLREG